MKKGCSPALKKRALAITNKLFEDCVREVMGLHTEDPDELRMTMDFVRTAKHAQNDLDYGYEEIQEMIRAATAVSDLYQEKIKALSTKDLYDILNSHERGGTKRAARTMDTILSELARRAIMDDSSESDLINNNGDVDGLTKQSKHCSKKASGTRNKANKG